MASTYSLKIRRGINNVQEASLNLKPGSSIFLMGICGTAMASLALHLQKQGFEVSGSDANVYPPMSDVLKKAGIDARDFTSKNISKTIDLVIVGNVIRKTHEEMQVVGNLNLPYISFPAYMEQTFLKDKKNIVIAGTHGKSTTTSMMAYLAQALGKDPGFFVGGVCKTLGVSLKASQSPWFIIEGDEYDSAFFAKHPKFLHYNPSYLILTSLDFDHADIYKDVHEIVAVFKDLVRGMSKKPGFILALAAEPWLEEIRKVSQVPWITFGLEQGDYKVKDVILTEQGSEFKILYKDQVFSSKLSLFGLHNVLNAVSCFAMAHQLGWPAEEVLTHLSQFQGVTRRFQKIAEHKDIILFEDFAHHPRAVSLTLQSLKTMYKNRRVIAMFEPRSWTSRLNVFENEYVDSLSQADVVGLVDPFDTTRIQEADRFSSKRVAQSLKDRGCEVIYKKQASELAKAMQGFIKKQDVLVLMSNGGFGHIAQKIKEILFKV